MTPQYHTFEAFGYVVKSTTYDDSYKETIRAEIERRMTIADNQVRILLDEQGDHKDWSYALHNPDDWQTIATEQAAYLSRL